MQNKEQSLWWKTLKMFGTRQHKKMENTRARDIAGPEWTIFRANTAGVEKTNKTEAKAGERR